MAFTEQEEQILRTRALIMDTGDGVGTFTADEIAQLKALLVDVEDAKAKELNGVAEGLAGRSCYPAKL